MTFISEYQSVQVVVYLCVTFINQYGPIFVSHWVGNHRCSLEQIKNRLKVYRVPYFITCCISCTLVLHDPLASQHEGKTTLKSTIGLLNGKNSYCPRRIVELHLHVRQCL